MCCVSNWFKYNSALCFKAICKDGLSCPFVYKKMVYIAVSVS